MLFNLLDGWFKINLGEGAFYAAFGFIFVFLGITLLVVLFTLLGLGMKKFNARKPRQKKVKRKKGEKILAEAPKPEEEISPETVAVISAAIAAYYERENVPCDFVVRRIKKL